MAFNRLHLIRQVDLFTLRLFLSAVEEQQIGRAAIRENIAASTATKRIQDLEEIAGVKLLERTPKGVVASPAGEVLARHVRAIFGHVDDMRSEITAFTEGVRGEVVVASARSIFAPFLSRELGDFARDFPMVDVVVRELENAEIAHAVAQGEADVGVYVATSEVDLSGIDVTPYRKDRLVAVVPRAHRLARLSSVRFEDLVTENVIAVGAMLAAFRVAAQRLGHEFKPKYSVKSAGVAISLVQARLGVSVQPECLLGLELFDEVSALPFDEPWATRVINIATSRGRPPSAAARALISQLVDKPAQAEDGQVAGPFAVD